MTATIDRTGADRREVNGDDDAAAVERRALTFARELGAVGDVGWLLAKRAAVVAGRMERLAERDELIIGMNVQAARDEFDADRRAERGRWLADLDGDDEGRVAAALAALELSPEGLDALHRLWGAILEGVRSNDPAAAAGPAARARRFLDATGVGAPEGAAGLAGMVAAEVARLRRRDDRTRPALERMMADARREVGVVAAFDTSPEAKLARRHEAAAERSLYRALKLIRDLRRDAGLAPAALAEALAPLPAPAPTPGTAGRPTAPPVAVGSFRVGLDAPPLPDAAPLASFSVGAVPERRRRPDLARAAGKRR